METPRSAAAEFLPPPAAGRVFTAGYPIRRTDVTPGGRLRLDALARYLQDAAEDDVADSGLSEPYDWLVRRCALTIRGWPRMGQRLRLATFCSATGPRLRLVCQLSAVRADLWLLNDRARLASAQLTA
jgi:acyl-ACP thioesterase